MRAMILAAGRGERMRPLTDSLPKPLLQAGGQPLIVWHIRRLASAGITQLVINHAWLGQLLEQALGDGRQWGVSISYSPEPQPLETATGIARALPLLGSQPFLVVNGDIWCDWDPHAAAQAATLLQQCSAQAWLLLADNPPHHPKGDFSLNAQGRVELDASAPRLTYTGIGVYSPGLFQGVGSEQPAPLGPLLRRHITDGHIIGSHYNGRWIDVGTPERLARLDESLRKAGSGT